MKHILITILIATATIANARQAWFIMPDGDGTITVQYEKSWNTPRNKPNQLAKLFSAPSFPAGVESKWYAWDGSKIVEASQEVKDTIGAAWAAANQKNPSQLGNEMEFLGMIQIIKGSVPIEKGSLRQLMDKAEAYIDGLPEANKPKARDKLDRLALLYQELKSDGVLYEAHLGRQITAGDYPQ